MPKPAPASELTAHPGHLLRRMQQVHTLLWTAMASEEITSPQFAVLNGLAGRPDSDQRTLGELAWLDRSTAADVIRRLADRGLVTRVRDNGDGRRNLLRLSAEGERVHQRLQARTTRMNEVMLAPLDDTERETLLSLMRRVVDAGERLRDLP